nr:uncharacterized protein LOC112803834 [Arachis hypogaea]
MDNGVGVLNGRAEIPANSDADEGYGTVKQQRVEASESREADGLIGERGVSLNDGYKDQCVVQDDRRVAVNQGHDDNLEDVIGHEDTEVEAEDSGSHSSILKEQLLENGRTWELAKELGAMLYNEEDDIMAILQAQNEEIARKRKVAKQKEKMRRCRSKHKKQVERWLCVEGVMLKSGFNCAFMLVFGAHNRDEKTHVWEELSYIAGLCQVLCCFLGGFNEIVHVEERKDATSLPRSAEDFKVWIQDMHLVDLSLTDRKFTWFRGRSCSRIDRALVNVEWLEEFPKTRLRRGPRGLSDHCPIIVEDKKLRGGPRPFRSLDSWFAHDGFLGMVKEEWKGLGDIQFTDKLKALTIPLGRWHKANCSEIDNKITRFEEEIKKIDDLVSNRVYDETMEARKKALVTCCESWYVRKEVHWKQMSRTRHAKEIDKNIRYGLVGKIDEEYAMNLEEMSSAAEIREAVWDCESSKVSGCDGYNMNFIKRCWGKIGSEFTTAVMEFFQTCRLLADTNITWVALAPKFVGAKEIKDLRPISMVGCVYKVISKVLVRRMRAVMPGLVGETQSAFVKGRKIHDGALIACETVKWLKLRKKKAAIIKLYFQKAYDRVKWSFVDTVLQKMGFGHRWRA